MPRELLITVNPLGRRLNGEVIVDRPVGGAISGAEVAEYFRSGTFPSTLLSYSDTERRDLILNQLQQLREGASDPRAQAAINERRRKAMLNGIDFQWGHQDLEQFAVITADVGPLDRSTVGPTDLERVYTVNYAALFPQLVASWATPGVRVPPERSTIVPGAQVITRPTGRR